MSGNGKHYVDFNEYEVEENTLFFISKGQIHHFYDTDYKGYIIHFNESFIADNENYVNIFLKHNIFHSFEKEPLFRIKQADCKELQNIVTQLWTPGQFAHAEYLRALLNIFFIVVQRFGIRKDCNGLSMNNPAYILFVTFRKLVEENYPEIHTVNRYAELLHVSAKTLTNCTKEVSLQTPLEIINERITLEARRLLSYSEKNITEIGYDLGFEDASYFIKFFKRQTNMLPGEFRKAIS